MTNRISSILTLLFCLLSYYSVNGFSTSRKHIFFLNPYATSKTAAVVQAASTFRSPAMTYCDTTPSLMMTNAVDSDRYDEADKANNKDTTTDPRRAYKISKWSFALVSALLFIIPDRTLTQELASKWGGSCGFGMGAFLLHLLSEDSSAEIREAQMPTVTKSEEYENFVKRCHLGLLGFSAFGLFAMPGEAAFWPGNPTLSLLTGALMTVTRMGGIWVAFQGWVYQIKDKNQWTNELWCGMKQNIKGLRIKDKKKGLFYRNSLLVVWGALISNFLQVIFQLRYKDALQISSFSTSLFISAVARLFLVSSVLYSLKVIAESISHEFDSSIFWRLNWTLAAWAGIGIGQGISYPFKFSINRAEMLAFSSLFFLKGYKEYKKRATIAPSTDKDSDGLTL